MRRYLVALVAAALLLGGCKVATGPFYSAGPFTACIARATDAAGQALPLAHGRTYVIWGTDCEHSPLADNNGRMIVQVQLYRWLGDNSRIFCGTEERIKHGAGSYVTVSAGIDRNDPGCVSDPGIRWQGRARGMITTDDGTEVWSDWHWADVELQTDPPASSAQLPEPVDPDARADLVFAASYPDVFGPAP